MNDVVLGKIVRESKRGRVLDAGQMAAARTILEGCGDLDRLGRLEQEQEALIRRQMLRKGRPTAASVEWMRTRDASFVENWEANRAMRSVARSGADRVADHVQKRSELGEIPKVDQEAIIARIVSDPVWACWHYFPAWFTRQPSFLTRAVIKCLWAVMLHGGNQSIGVPRGAGKSTITKALLLLAGMCGLIRYSVVFGSSGKASRSLLRDVKLQLETNEILLADFPAACLPIRALGGRSQRCASQCHHGERTYVRYENDVIQLARIGGYKCSGFILRCTGIESGFLGLVDNGTRPDFILGDDIQSLESAASDDMVASLESAIRQGFEGLGGKDNPLRIVLLATCTRENDFSDRVLNPEVYPEYSGLRLGMVEDWGTGLDLWTKYGDLWRQDQRDGDKQYKIATAHYLENRAAMDDGVRVTDPEFYQKDTEHSAIQAAWHMRMKMGDEAYFAQIENRPLSPRATLYDLSSVKVAMSLNHLKRRSVPEWAHAVFAGSDVMGDKLRWTVVAAGSRMRTAVIDYGFYPQTGIIVPKNSSPQAAMDHLWKAMEGLCQFWAGSVYMRGELAMRITAGGFDRGYMAEAVQTFCRAKSATFPFPIIPLRGQGGSQWRPSNRNTIRAGWHTQMVSLAEGAAPGEFINVHTDFWKETVQRAFLCDSPAAPGACSLFGGDARSHAEFGDQICAEILADKGRGAAGTDFYKWVLRPGSNNHWLDSTVICYALAGFYGTLRAEDADTSAADQTAATPLPRPQDGGRKVNPLRQSKVKMEE